MIALYLPRAYAKCLQFLLQADFILIANREDMILHSDWNQALLNALAECFVKAVERFNHRYAKPLRYCWLGFLRDVPVPISTISLILASSSSWH